MYTLFDFPHRPHAPYARIRVKEESIVVPQKLKSPGTRDAVLFTSPWFQKKNRLSPVSAIAICMHASVCASPARGHCHLKNNYRSGGTCHLLRKFRFLIASYLRRLTVSGASIQHWLTSRATGWLTDWPPTLRSITPV